MNPDSANERAIRLRDRFREETAEAILSSAEETFADEGLRGTRMESIAARAGVAVGTLYNHFEDREALFSELLRSRREALLERLDEAIAIGERQPFPEALRLFLQALFSHWAAHRRFMSLLFQSEYPIKAAQSGSKCRTTRQEIVARARKVIRRGRSSGALRSGGGELHVAALVGMAWGILMAALEEQRLDRVGEQVESVVDLFLHGVGR